MGGAPDERGEGAFAPGNKIALQYVSTPHNNQFAYFDKMRTLECDIGAASVGGYQHSFVLTCHCYGVCGNATGCEGRIHGRWPWTMGSM